MNIHIEKAIVSDLPDILELQKIAFQAVADLLANPKIQPMIQTCDELLQEFNDVLF